MDDKRQAQRDAYEIETIKKQLCHMIDQHFRKRYFGEVTLKFQYGELRNVEMRKSMDLTGFILHNTQM